MLWSTIGWPRRDFSSPWIGSWSVIKRTVTWSHPLWRQDSVTVCSVKSSPRDPSGVGSLEDCRIHTTLGMAFYWECRVGEFLNYLRNYQLLLNGVHKQQNTYFKHTSMNKELQWKSKPQWIHLHAVFNNKAPAMKSRQYNHYIWCGRNVANKIWITLVKLALFICGLSMVTRSVHSSTTIHTLLTLKH